jgi:hypothetical protein
MVGKAHCGDFESGIEEKRYVADVRETKNDSNAKALSEVGESRQAYDVNNSDEKRTG